MPQPTALDAMTYEELEAHIKALVKEQKTQVKNLRALLRTKPQPAASTS